MLYDIDFPGHQLREIRTVSLTIPCIVGPYTSLDGTLRLLAQKYRRDSKAPNPSDYPESTSLGLDSRFSTVNVPINTIAVSNGQNDAYVVEVKFIDERFLPFDAAGAINIWRLELPNENYEIITDILLQIRFTSRDGGANLQVAASKSVHKYIKSVNHLSATKGLLTFFDIKSEFASKYYGAMKVQPPATTIQHRVLTLPYFDGKLPIYTRGTSASKVLRGR